MANITLLAALGRDQSIGKGNDLPWHLPDDLKRFKALTLGSTLLMGRKTAESLGRALPQRTNLVLTRSGQVPFDKMTAVSSLEEAQRLTSSDASLLVIGGGEVYRYALPFANRLRLTHVEANCEGADAFFPEFDASQWKVCFEAFHPADDRHQHAFRFVDYERVI